MRTCPPRERRQLVDGRRSGTAHAFWLRAPGRGEIRPVTLPEPGRGDVVVRTAAVRASAAAPRRWCSGAACRRTSTRAMRAPFQEGDFPGPVKYGYLNVGAVEQGPPELRGRTVFCLYPHQTAYVVPAGAVSVVPEGVPPARAVLAGTVETAVNALWDAAPLVGDRVAVVGAGMVGCCVARLLGRFPAHARSRSSTSIPAAPTSRTPSASTSRSRRRRRRPRPGRAHERDVGGPPALARPARARGHRHRPQLVRRRGGAALAGRGVPRRAASASARARSAPSPRPAARAARRPTGWRSRSTCCATPPSTRCSPASRASTSCPT